MHHDACIVLIECVERIGKARTLSVFAEHDVLDAAEHHKAVGSDSLARTFWRLGWIGFWAQVTIGAIPLVLTVYAFLFDRNATTGTRGGLALIEYLTVGSLLVLAFTTFWFYRYTRLAKQITDPQRRPSDSALKRAAGIGVAASALGILFSMLVMLFEVVQLFFYFLRAPQAGVPVVQTTAGGPTSWISASDMLSLLALNISLLVEICVLAFSMWLLFRMLTASEFADAANAE